MRYQSQSRVSDPASSIPRGFTLVELMVVIVIISIIIGFILSAATDARRRAEERATQSLIAKLEAGLNDRIEALLLSQPDPTQAHKALAAVYLSGVPIGVPQPALPWPVTQRSQVFATYDYIKSEMPDVFFVQPAPSTTGSTPYYPINFAAHPYLPSGATTVDSSGLGNYILPIGNSIAFPYGDGNVYNPAGNGIYGASYAAAAGLYKNLGYLPQGYDMADNNQNGYIDEWAEGVTSVNQTQVQTNLNNHTHNTARSEMLYALLIEGRGPLGSIFTADDFTDREVQDTDQDGLPEFVDAWGQPLQFFRWPLLYHSDLQRGQELKATSENSWTIVPPYFVSASAPATNSMFITREQDPLDLNQQLVAPAWWSTYNSGPYTVGGPSKSLGASNAAQEFELLFHRLTEPYPTPGGAFFWDRGTTYGGRRAYYSKFLIVSSGLNQQLGVFLYSNAVMQVSSANSATTVATALVANENNAMPFGLDVVDFTTSASIPSASLTINSNPSNDPTNPSSSDLIQGAQDDISNQNIQSSGTTGGSG